MTRRSCVVVLLCLALFVLVSRPTFAQPFIYVANAGDDTVSKIDVTLNSVVATYRTWFGSPSHHFLVGPAPSRIAVDSVGDVYVLNRFFGPNYPTFPCVGGFPACHLPVLVKILHSGGVPGLSTSNVAPLSLVDQNGDGHIDIPSTPVEATDVRIAWAKEIGSPGDEGGIGRALCLGLDGNLWVGLHHTAAPGPPYPGAYYKVSSATGQTLAGPISTPGHFPYGCVVDSSGRLWSASGSGNVAEIDTKTNTVTKIWDHSVVASDFGNNYAISLLGGCGQSSKIYLSEVRYGRTHISLDPGTGGFSNAPLSIPQFHSYAIAVTSDGNIVSGNSLYGAYTDVVVKYDPSGNVLWHSPSQTGFYPNGHVHGLIEDALQDLWTVNLFDDSISKYRGSDGAPLGVVGVGRYPYTYENGSPPNCPCALIDKSSIQCSENGVPGTYSYSFVFTNNSPFPTPATSIVISPSTGVTSFTPASPVTIPPLSPGGQGSISGTLTVASGQAAGAQVCLNVKLQGGDDKDPWCCPNQPVCFVLPECRACAKAKAQFKCNEKGWYLELTVSNGGPSQATSVQVFSTTPGVTVTPVNTSVSLAQGGSTTLQLGLIGATPGQTVDLTVNLHGPTDAQTGAFTWCCSAIVKVVYPKMHCLIIGGQVFHDKDRNGIPEYEEEGLSGWVVVLEGNEGERQTATTDRVGAYHFDDVQPGAYRLTVRNPGGPWRATSPDSGSYAITVDGQTAKSFNFGFVKP